MLKEARNPSGFPGGQLMFEFTFPAEPCHRFTRFRLIFIFSFLLVCAQFGVRAQAPGVQTRWLRTPTVSATEIAFAYANNIWTVPRAGGSARRLTSFQGQTTNPHFSPDGKWIAFSGEYAGNLGVAVVAAEGGAPKEPNRHPSVVSVPRWTPDATP